MSWWLIAGRAVVRSQQLIEHRPHRLLRDFHRVIENYHPIGRLAIASRLVSSYEVYGVGEGASRELRNKLALEFADSC